MRWLNWRTYNAPESPEKRLVLWLTISQPGKDFFRTAMYLPYERNLLFFIIDISLITIHYVFIYMREYTSNESRMIRLLR